jgi:hypothetical protein
VPFTPNSTAMVRSSTLADGVLDRLVHNAHRSEIPGDSRRKNRGKSSIMFATRAYTAVGLHSRLENGTGQDSIMANRF